MAKRSISLVRHTAFSDDSIVTKREAMRAAKPRAASASAKVVNYTSEQTTKMVADYQAGVTVAAIATELGKTARSIIAKLSREKVYKAKAYTTKTGEAVVKKEALADRLTVLADLTASEADSLTKANKTALAKIVALLEPEMVE